jgi:hypothetical protein
MGREGTGSPGTATAATTIWLGTVTMVDETAIEFVEESIGNYAGYGRTYIPREGAAVTFEAVPASFEQFLHPLEAGIETASTSASGSLYTRTYSASTSSEQTIMTYTLEVGDGEDVEESEYAFCESFSLSGSFDEAVMLQSQWRGRQVSSVAFTGSLSRPSTEIAIFNTGKLYIDDSSGTAGTTQVSNSFRSFSLDVNTGWRGIQTADGNLYFTFTKLVDPEVMLTITAEHTSDWDSAGEKAKWLAENIRLIRLAFTGAASPGSRMYIDLAGKWQSFSAIEESDGNSVLTGVFRAFWSTTDTLFAEFNVITNLATVP